MSGRVKGSGVLGRWIIIIRKKDTGAEGRCHGRVDTNDTTYIRQAWRVSGSKATRWRGVAWRRLAVVWSRARLRADPEARIYSPNPSNPSLPIHPPFGEARTRSRSQFFHSNSLRFTPFYIVHVRA